MNPEKKSKEVKVSEPLIFTQKLKTDLEYLITFIVSPAEVSSVTILSNKQIYIMEQLLRNSRKESR